MSLTSHLKNPRSPVRAFMLDRFPNTRDVVKECRSRLIGVETILPPASDERYAYDLIGMAFDYRLRFYFAETPLQDLVAYEGMTAVEAVAFRLIVDHETIDKMIKRGTGWFDLGGLALESVPLAEVTTDEVLTDIPHPLQDISVSRGGLSYHQSTIADISANLDALHAALYGRVFLIGGTSVAVPNVDDFAVRLGRATAESSPVGRRLPRPQEELLARYCIILSLYEMIYRSGHIPEALRVTPSDLPFTPPTVDQLLAIPKPIWIDDLCNLSWAFHDDNVDQLQRTAILNPTFDGSAHVGGADADLILDGCLLESKVTIDAGLKKVRDWLFQLLGYALLDYKDKHKIRSVAIYLPRQRTVLRWTLEDLIDRFSHPSSPPLGGSKEAFRKALGELRAEFRRVVAPDHSQ